MQMHGGGKRRKLIVRQICLSSSAKGLLKFPSKKVGKEKRTFVVLATHGVGVLVVVNL